MCDVLVTRVRVWLPSPCMTGWAVTHGTICRLLKIPILPLAEYHFAPFGCTRVALAKQLLRSPIGNRLATRLGKRSLQRRNLGRTNGPGPCPIPGTNANIACNRGGGGRDGLMALTRAKMVPASRTDRPLEAMLPPQHRYATAPSHACARSVFVGRGVRARREGGKQCR